jgi:hypothetical protein
MFHTKWVFVGNVFLLKCVDLYNLISVFFSPENNRINNLSVLCGSNERSEWAVS